MQNCCDWLKRTNEELARPVVVVNGIFKGTHG